MNEGTRYGTTVHPRRDVQDSDAYNPTIGLPPVIGLSGGMLGTDRRSTRRRLLR